MKSIRFVKLYLILLVCLCSGLSMQAQPIRPDQPIINRVSVDPLTGFITIEWDMPPKESTLDADGFLLRWHYRWYDNSDGKWQVSNYPIDTIWDPAVRIYTFRYDTMTVTNPMMSDPRNTDVLFGVQALHREPYYASLHATLHYNMYVTNVYDPCRAEIKLCWNTYGNLATNGAIQPSNRLVSYHVMRIPNDGNPQHDTVRVLAPSDTFYVVRQWKVNGVDYQVKENENYKFYIKAILDSKEVATSFRTEQFTQMPIPPDTIIAVSTLINSDGLAEITFKLDDNAETYSYEFYGASNPRALVSLGRYDIHGDTVLIDKQKREKTYYYKLEAWHVCNNKFTASSNTATALWLSYKRYDQVISLVWDSYFDWGGYAEYKLYRKIGINLEEVIYDVTDPGTTAFDDDLTGIYIDGAILYWVEAMPMSRTPDENAISNIVRITPESDIWIPQAFTPNNPGSNPIAPNDRFKPYFSYIPQDTDELQKMGYILHVYDRTGAKVFETKDVNEGWDGKLMNGKPASEGVYTYYLKYRTATGRPVEKKGTFVLLLP